MKICCLDLEGVLLPEIWLGVAERFKMNSLKLTTRDIPNYDKLMRYRLDILKKEKITLSDIQRVIKTLKPLPGAVKFLDRLREKMSVIILSDTFYEFPQPLMKHLGYPTLFCNWLHVNSKDMITGYTLRQRDGKKKAVKALKKLGFQVVAAGDSYNDLSMLQEAHKGVLFNPPASIVKSHGKKFAVASNYDSLLKNLVSE